MEASGLDITKQNETIQNSIISSIKSIFPIVGKYRTMQISDLHIDTDLLPTNDLPLQKDIKLSGKSWEVPLHAQVSVVDNKTGKVLEKAKLKLTNIPKITPRYSTIIKGNEYQTSNQFRLKSGVYTREKENKEVESQFNLEKGFNFKLNFNPEKQIFFLTAKNQNYHLYTLLRALGISDNEMQKAWGKEIFEKNQRAGINLEFTEIPQLYKRVRHKDVDFITALEALKKYFSEETSINPETTKTTLGASSDRVTPELFLSASRKLLAVVRKDVPSDERDSLIFKKLYSIDDLLNAHFEARKEAIGRGIKYRLDTKTKPREILSADTFTKPILEFFYKGELSSTPTQTNPIDMATEHEKTTIMGTGGVRSEHAITDRMRDVHPSHMGFLDAVATTEGKPGINLNLSAGIEKNKKGELTTVVVLKNGKTAKLTPFEIYNLKLGYPDQYKRIDKNTIKPLARNIKAIYMGKATTFPANEIDAYLGKASQLFTYSTNLIPFLNYNSGGRAMYASKQMAQAVPLINPEAPLVQTQVPGKPFTWEIALSNYLNPRVGEGNDGVVNKITDDYIYVKRNSDNKTIKIGLYNKFPLNQETYLHSTPIVSVGDDVGVDKILASNNFQQYKAGNKGLALGTNLLTAYLPWRGQTFDDSVVISESASNKLTSIHYYKEDLKLSKTGIQDIDKYNAYFPGKLTSENVRKLDSNGVIKEGETVQPGEYLAVYMEPRELTDEEKILKSMKKILAQPLIDHSVLWDHETPGVVRYVRTLGRTIRIHVETKAPAKVGDKLSSRAGAKGIISKIIPDPEMPQTIDGKAIEYIVSPLGYPGRTNTGQILETAASKIALKTKKPYVVENFDNVDYLEKIKKDLKTNNISAEETLLDGIGGQPFENPILTGPQHVYKLRHIIEKKFTARDYGKNYSTEEQPAGTSPGKGSSLDQLQSYSMLAHGAKANLYDALAVKGQKNDEYWRAVALGLPIPHPNQNFVWDKFKNYMKGVGVDIVKEGNYIRMIPFTDKHLLKLSAGKINNAGYMLKGKNLAEIKGGLFDTEITGGVNGKKFSHIELSERMPNPMYEKATKTILDLTDPEFRKIISGKKEIDGLTGLKAIEKALKTYDVNKQLTGAKESLKTAKTATNINKLNSKVHYLQALKTTGYKPNEVYLMKYVPVLPPIFRPIVPLVSGDLHVSPINEHYRDIAILDNALRKEKLLQDEDRLGVLRLELYDTLKAAQGHIEPKTYKKAKYEGILHTLAGSSPKKGFMQDKLWKKRQDLSGRTTITLEPDLGLDEIGLPDDMSKKLYKPFVIRELVRTGFTPVAALKNIQDWSPIANKALDNVMENRPVILNRAPSLHKWNVQAFIPRRHTGKDLKFNPIVQGFNADFNGDSVIANTYIYTRVLNPNFGYKYYNGSIGDFVKKFLLNNVDDEYLIQQAKGATWILEMQNLEVLGTNTNNEVKYMQANEVTIHTSHGKCYEIKFPHCIPLTVSEHHNFSYIDMDTLKEEKIKTEDMKEGQIIPLVKTIIIDEITVPKEVEIKDPSGKPTDSRTKINTKPKLDLNLGYFIGYYIGDGSITGNQRGTISQACSIKETQDIILKVYKNSFNFSGGVAQDFRNYECGGHLKFSCTVLAKWLEYECGKGALNKHFPYWYLNTPKEFRKGLIAGLIDAEGCFTQGGGTNKVPVCVIQMISKEALIQFKILLKTFGIQSALSKENRKTKTNNNDVYSLRINTIQLDEIPLHPDSPKKKHYEELKNKSSRKVLRSTMDMVPFNQDLFDEIQILGKKNHNLKKEIKIQKEKWQSEYCKKYNIDLLVPILLKDSKDKKLITRFTAIKLIAEKIHIHEKSDLLKKWISIVENNNIKYSTIESIKEVVRELITYDFSLPIKETFVVNDGLITHNTMAVYIPTSDGAVDEAWAMLPSKNMFHPSTNPYEPNIIHTLSKEYLLGLYHMSRDGKQTTKEYKTLREAQKAEEKGEILVRDFIKIGTKKTTLGRELLSEALPGDLKVSDKIDNKKLEKLLIEVANKYPQDLTTVMNKFKDYGKHYGHRFGTSISLNDFDIPENNMKEIIKRYASKITSSMSDPKKAQVWVNMTNELYNTNEKAIKNLKRPNNFKYILDSGAISGGKSININQITSALGAVKDMSDQPLSTPILSNWGHGLDSWEYWQQLYGSRRGLVDKAIKTQDSGELNKSLLSNTKGLLILEEDCGTLDFLELDIEDKSLVGRFLAVDTPKIGKRNTLVDPQLVTKALGKGITSIKVRSPLTCETAQGVCQMCYGVLPDGKVPLLGYNVGVVDAQSLTERSCNHSKSICLIKYNNVNELITLENLWSKFEHLGVTATDDTEIINTLKEDLYVLYDKHDYIKLNKIGRHKPTSDVVLIKTKNSSFTVCQDNHPLPIYKNNFVCEHCGKWLYSSYIRKNGTTGCFYCNKHTKTPEEKFNPHWIKIIPQNLNKYLDALNTVLPLSEITKQEVVQPLTNYWTGFYIAEGCVSYGKTRKLKPRCTGISIKQKDNNELMKNLQKDHPQYSIKKHKSLSGTNYRINGKEFGLKMEKLYGRYSHNKHLPLNSFLHYDRIKILEILAGLIDGDGFTTSDNYGTCLVISTNSYLLAQQLYLLCRKFKWNFNILADSDNRMMRHQGWKIYLYLKQEDYDYLSIISQKCAEITDFKTAYEKIDSNLECIKSIKKIKYHENYVYDVETENSLCWYCGIMSHNTQLTLSAFHTGASAAGKAKTTAASFKDLDEIFKVPEVLPGKATISSRTGQISAIRNHPAGGYEVFIGETAHYIPVGLNLVVKVNDKVKAGDKLSEGKIKPQELIKYKDIKDVQLDMVNRIKNIYGDQFHSRVYETVIRGISDLAELTEVPDDIEDLYPGDTIYLSLIKQRNKQRREENKPLIKYKSYFKAVGVQPQDRDDFLAGMSSGHIKRNLIEAAARMRSSNIHGHDPLPGMLYAAEFGKKFNPDKGEFY